MLVISVLVVVTMGMSVAMISGSVIMIVAMGMSVGVICVFVSVTMISRDMLVVVVDSYVLVSMISTFNMSSGVRLIHHVNFRGVSNFFDNLLVFVNDFFVIDVTINDRSNLFNYFVMCCNVFFFGFVNNNRFALGSCYLSLCC